MKIVDVASDGNCLYHCLTYFLNKHDKNNVHMDEVKKDIITMEILAKENLDHIEEVSELNAWGTDIEIMWFCTLNNCKVMCYTFSKEGDYKVIYNICLYPNKRFLERKYEDIKKSSISTQVDFNVKYLHIFLYDNKQKMYNCYII